MNTLAYFKKSDEVIDNLSDAYREENHYSSVDRLTKLQQELGYKEGDLSAVAVLGLVGEAGEVLAEVEFQVNSIDSVKANEYVKNTPVPISGNLITTTIKMCRDIETFKKAIRSRELHVVCFLKNKDLFIKELADDFYYLNILATNQGLTVFDLAQMAHDKIKSKQAEGGSSEDLKS